MLRCCLYYLIPGVVFHYRASTDRYNLDYQKAIQACQNIGASIATYDQMKAAYEDGFDQCDAGWIADQTVRFVAFKFSVVIKQQYVFTICSHMKWCKILFYNCEMIWLMCYCHPSILCLYRYPITNPRKGCFGNLLAKPGIRSYGTRRPTDTYDVYCYVDKLDGKSAKILAFPNSPDGNQWGVI